MKALTLTAAQVAEIEPHLRPGTVLICKLTREQFDGANASTSGRLTVEFGSVPAASLPALREAITKANTPAKAKRPRISKTNSREEATR